MATAQNKLILYDDACPMCKAYTAAFVRVGILPAAGRVGFADASPADLKRIDTDRARHEIPLLDREGGETVYGLEALFTLLRSRFLVLSVLLHSRALGAVFSPVYRYISYNRRVIAGCAPTPVGTNGFDCAPDFSLSWRVTHLVLCFVGWLLLLRNVAAELPILGASIAVSGGVQVVGMVLAITVLPRYCGVWDRAGSLATNAVTFGLLLALLTAIANGVTLATWLGFAASVFLTLIDANRRLRPRCAVQSPPRRLRFMLPMADGRSGEDSVLRCVRCRRK